MKIVEVACFWHWHSKHFFLFPVAEAISRSVGKICITIPATEMLSGNWNKANRPTH